MAAIGQIRKFTRNTDWLVFKTMLEQYFFANGIPDDTASVKKRKRIFLKSIDKDCYKLVLDLSAPSKPENKTYEQLVALLDRYFSKVGYVFVERKIFYSATKNQDETVSQWAARVMNLAANCKFGEELLVTMRDKFIMGFEAGPIMDKLFEEDENLTFERAVSIAAKEEAVQANLKSCNVKESVQGKVQDEAQNSGFSLEQAHMLDSNNKSCVCDDQSKASAASTCDQNATADVLASKNTTTFSEQQKMCNACNQNMCRYRDYLVSFCNVMGHLAAVRKKHRNPTNKQEVMDQNMNCLINLEAFSAYPPNNPSEKSIDLREDSSIDSKSESNGRSKVRNIIKKSSSRMRSRLYLSSDDYDSEDEYTPKPVRKVERSVPSYIPSSKSNSESELKENETIKNDKRQFIITLDGIDKFKFLENKLLDKSRPNDSDKKQSPSSTVSIKKGKSTLESKTCRANIPDILPIVHPPISVKNKERCKYWPSCRQGDKCEFVHPTEACKMFPQCKFGEKCLFLHPKCKFGNDCTKRECHFTHSTAKSLRNPSVPSSSPNMQSCKFFPNCAFANCPFYHPKPCKYGKYCKNIAECNFSHAFVVHKKSMSWSK